MQAFYIVNKIFLPSLPVMVNDGVIVMEEQTVCIDDPGSRVDATLWATTALTHFPLLLGALLPCSN